MQSREEAASFLLNIVLYKNRFLPLIIKKTFSINKIYYKILSIFNLSLSFQSVNSQNSVPQSRSPTIDAKFGSLSTSSSFSSSDVEEEEDEREERLVLILSLRAEFVLLLCTRSMNGWA